MNTTSTDFALPEETRLAEELNTQGWSIAANLLKPADCRFITSLYESPQHFRSQVHMTRHGFGRGEYRYFCYPLFPLIGELRSALYRHLAPIANCWHARMHVAARFPGEHGDYLAQCHAAGQCRPTPLLLRYGPGDFNCLHQDLYGEHVFPLQAAVLLSDPATGFTGGEFILTEQRPRMQSRAEVIPLNQGDAVIFAVNARPKAGNRGDYRVTLRHGVSTVRSGQRHALGIIFHDAV